MNVQEILGKIESLAPMPAVAVKLLQAAQDPDVDLGEVAAWIERDPAMTTNLLRLCNAPYYGLRSEVTSVRQATGFLGLRKIVQVALSVLSSGYLTPAQEGYALASGELWKSSVAAAIASELLARKAKYSNASTAYTAGLLQDMGKIVLADVVGDKLSDIRRLTEEEGLAWDEAERQVVGMPHPEVGAMLLERWGFPDPLVEAVRTHHDPSRARIDPTLAHIAHVADALAMTLGLGIGADGLAYGLDEASLDALGIASRQELDAIVEDLAAAVQSADTLFVPPPPSRGTA